MSRNWKTLNGKLKCVKDEKIKIYLASFAAGKSDKVHEHGPNTAYIIKGGTIKVLAADGTVSERSFPDGAVAYSDNIVRHQVENIGSTDIKVLIASSNVDVTASCRAVISVKPC